MTVTPAEERRIREKVQRAREVEVVLHRLGWAVLAIGVCALVGITVLLVAGELDLEKALAAYLSTALGSILAGATAYGAGTNVGLGAERLELALPPADTEGPPSA